MGLSFAKAGEAGLVHALELECRGQVGIVEGRVTGKVPAGVKVEGSVLGESSAVDSAIVLVLDFDGKVGECEEATVVVSHEGASGGCPAVNAGRE
jgi:hypothetical protein